MSTQFNVIAILAATWFLLTIEAAPLNFQTQLKVALEKIAELKGDAFDGCCNASHTCIYIPYTRKFSPGQKFFQFCHHWRNFYHVNFLSCVNDCIEDMATFTALAKIYFTKIFLQYKGIWGWQNFCQVKIFTYMVHNGSQERLPYFFQKFGKRLIAIMFRASSKF